MALSCSQKSDSVLIVEESDIKQEKDEVIVDSCSSQTFIPSGINQVDCIRMRNSLTEIIEELKLRRNNDIENEDKIRHLIQEKYELERQLDLGKNKLLSLSEDHEKKTLEVKRQFEDQIKDLQAEVKQNEVFKDCFQKETKALKDDIRNLQLTNYNLEKKLKDQGRKLQLQTSSANQHLHQLSSAEDKFQSVSGYCKKLFESQERLSRNVKEAVKLNRELMYTNEHQKCIINQHKREITSLQNQLLDAKVKLDYRPVDTRSIQNEEEVRNLKQELENLREERESTLQDLAKASDNYKETLLKLQDSHKLIERHLQIAEDYKRETIALKVELETCQNKLNQLESAYDGLHKDFNTQKAVHSEAVDKWSKEEEILSSNISELQDEIKTLQSAKDKVEKLNSDMTEQNLKLSEDLKAAKAILEVPKEDGEYQTVLSLLIMTDSECQAMPVVCASGSQTDQARRYTVPIQTDPIPATDIGSQTYTPALAVTATQTKEPSLINRGAQTEEIVQEIHQTCSDGNKMERQHRNAFNSPNRMARDIEDDTTLADKHVKSPSMNVHQQSLACKVDGEKLTVSTKEKQIIYYKDSTECLEKQKDITIDKEIHRSTRTETSVSLIVNSQSDNCVENSQSDNCVENSQSYNCVENSQSDNCVQNSQSNQLSHENLETCNQSKICDPNSQLNQFSHSKTCNQSEKLYQNEASSNVISSKETAHKSVELTKEEISQSGNDEISSPEFSPIKSQEQGHLSAIFSLKKKFVDLCKVKPYMKDSNPAHDTEKENVGNVKTKEHDHQRFDPSSETLNNKDNKKFNEDIDEEMNSCDKEQQPIVSKDKHCHSPLTTQGFLKRISEKFLSSVSQFDQELQPPTFSPRNRSRIPVFTSPKNQKHTFLSPINQSHLSMQSQHSAGNQSQELIHVSSASLDSQSNQCLQKSSLSTDQPKEGLQASSPVTPKKLSLYESHLESYLSKMSSSKGQQNTIGLKPVTPRDNQDVPKHPRVVEFLLPSDKSNNSASPSGNHEGSKAKHVSPMGRASLSLAKKRGVKESLESPTGNQMVHEPELSPYSRYRALLKPKEDQQETPTSNKGRQTTRKKKGILKDFVVDVSDRKSVSFSKDIVKVKMMSPEQNLSGEQSLYSDDEEEMIDLIPSQDDSPEEKKPRLL